MAVCTLNFCSRYLKKSTELTLVIPDSSHIGGRALSERKVLWLLHGLSNNDTAWVRLSRIECYCEEHDLVAVMPDGERSFYSDDFHGQNYFGYITEELPEYLEQVFGLSRRREDNFIAGLSMGGYGALRMGLTYPEHYFAVGSFSGVTDLRGLFLPELMTPERVHDFAFLKEQVGDPAASPMNPPVLLDPEKDKDLKLYISCGLEDDLLALSYAFEARCRELGIPYRCEHPHGGHEWNEWDRAVQSFIRFALEEEK